MVEAVEVEVTDANTQVAVEEEELSYEDMFAEEWGEGTPAQEEPEPEPEDAEDTADAAEEITDPDDAGSTTHEEENQEQDEPAAEPKSDDPYSWIEALPDEVKEQAKALKHSALSDQGRVAAYNRRVRDLQDEIDRMKTRPASSTAAEAPEPSSAAPELPEKFKQLKEDFPEFADAVEAIRQYDRELWNQELTEKLTPFEQERTVAKRSAFDAAVTKEAEAIFNTEETGVHWQDVVEGEDFRAWLADQPNSVKRAAVTPDASEAVYVLRQYERDYQAAIADLDSNQNEQIPVQKEEPSHSKADAIQTRRKQRKQTGVTPGSKPIQSDPDAQGGDYEAEFNRTWGGKS